MKKFFSNLWYHYKTYIIVLGVIAAIGVILAVNFFSRVDADMTVIVFTENALFDADITAAENQLESKITDLNGDGKIEVTVKNIVYGGTDNDTTFQERLLIEMTNGKASLILSEESGVRTVLKYKDTVQSISSEFDFTEFDGRALEISSASVFNTSFYYMPESFYAIVRDINVDDAVKSSVFALIRDAAEADAAKN